MIPNLKAYEFNRVLWLERPSLKKPSATGEQLEDWELAHLYPIRGKIVTASASGSVSASEFEEADGVVGSQSVTIVCRAGVAIDYTMRFRDEASGKKYHVDGPAVNDGEHGRMLTINCRERA